ncbi:MAG: hypothetical protein Rubg2KO_36630 [Rubricoccaceae bacterium]
MSLHNLFNTASRSLLSYQAASNATGQNIANVETQGYTRRTVQMRSIPAMRGGVVFHGTLSPGGGVGVESFKRMRSQILDTAVRNGQAGSGGAGESAALLATLESQLSPDGGDAFLGAIGDFFNAWSDVASYPTDLSVRDNLMSTADRLAQTLRSAEDRVLSFGRSVEQDLQGTVNQTNAILSEVAELNVAIRSSGGTDADSMDRRDVLLDDLAGLVPFDARTEADGSMTVSINGMVAVQEGEALPLRLTLPPEAPEATLYAFGGTRPLQLDATEGGALGAQLSTLANDLPNALDALDALANDIVTTVNDLHRAGTGLDGGSGRDFFDPSGTSARTLSLASGLTSDAIAAGDGAPGDSSVANAIFELAEASHASATHLLSGVGSQVRSARLAAEANAAYADHAAALRDSVSRVSLDEEMTNLIQYQQAYAASARVLETAESLFDTLLTL